MDEIAIKMQQKHAELLREQREKVRISWQHPERYRQYFDATIDICYSRYNNYIFNGFHEMAARYAKKVGIK